MSDCIGFASKKEYLEKENYDFESISDLHGEKSQELSFFRADQGCYTGALISSISSINYNQPAI